MNNRFKDHTQILIYGFASSLLAAVLLFTVVAVSATREAGRIIREAEENNPSRQNTVVPDKDNREGKTDEKENGEAQSGNASEQASKGESGDGTLSPEEQEAEADSTAPTENSTPVPYQGAEIRSLDASEIAAIESTYDLALRGFGTGFNDPKDDYNRSAYVVDVQNDLNAAGIRGRCFVS
ncbi:MAG: hypothetical protein IKR59_03585, partial [Lachnospiraceae bacterium]|nr:hypothetical protein [Lachnospiraceae bacterium]